MCPLPIILLAARGTARVRMQRTRASEPKLTSLQHHVAERVARHVSAVMVHIFPLYRDKTSEACID